MAERRLGGEAIFGFFDGLNTSIGVICGSAHAPHRLLIELGLTISLTGAMSMGAGTVLESNDKGWREALVMGGFTAAGTFLLIPPVLLLPLLPAFTLVAAIALASCLVIARARGGQRRDYEITYTMLAAVAIPTVLVAVAFGATG